MAKYSLNKLTNFYSFLYSFLKFIELLVRVVSISGFERSFKKALARIVKNSTLKPLSNYTSFSWNMPSWSKNLNKDNKAHFKELLSTVKYFSDSPKMDCHFFVKRLKLFLKNIFLFFRKLWQGLSLCHLWATPTWRSLPMSKEFGFLNFVKKSRPLTQNSSSK